MASSASDPVGLPHIGLTTYVEEARWGIWDQPAALVPRTYLGAVVDAHGLAVLLPPVVTAGAGARALDGIDGLILIGGADIDPTRYDAEAHPQTQDLRPDRDRWEIDLVHAALDRDLPTLTICRGTQLLNVALGGSLHQHLPDVVGHHGHCPAPGVFGTTKVRTAPGTPVAAIFGGEIKVPCHHHQAIDRTGDGVTAAAWADDGTIEAVLVADRRFVVGVQWHPEQGDDPRLVEALVRTAREAP